MLARFTLAALSLTALALPAFAQQSGGVQIAPGLNGGPVGLARPLPMPMPLITAQQVQNGMTASDHQAMNQNMISKLRGDPGFLSGFQFGLPLASSRQVVQQQAFADDGGYEYRRHHHGHGHGPVIINNEGPLAVTVGNGNTVQQQSSIGTQGPVAQQQVVNLPGSIAGSAVNQAGGSGRKR
ncbi:MAG TPA: hypothetical protein VFG62_23490 [Rhodopila sp.]|nr:hypothetical protein [Rhodopila sp.]